MAYRYIKDLVFDFVRKSEGLVDYDALTAEVLKHFPNSAWKKSHWAYWKSKIVTGNVSEKFSECVLENLSKTKVSLLKWCAGLIFRLLKKIASNRGVASKP